MRRALQLLSIFLLMGVQVFAGACSLSPLRPRSVVLIVIDTLRQDHLGIYGYPRPTSPNIDRMAVDAAVFDRAVSASTCSQAVKEAPHCLLIPLSVPYCRRSQA